MGQENIVRYWHAVELLQPQSAPKLEKRDSPYSSFFHDITVEQLVMPWSPESPVAAQTLPKNRTWSHTLYAHLYDSRDVASKLKELYGSDEGYKEPQSRESALFSLKFTADGLMVPDSLVLSSEAWFLGRALANKDWTDGFDDDQRAMREQIKPLMGGLISADALRKLLHVIRDFLGVSDFFGDPGSRRLRFRSAPIKTNKPEQEDDPLNSFLLADLSHVAQSLHQGITSTPLDHYLQVHEPKHRLHLDTDDASLPLIERLMPDSYSKGCWPSEGHRGLVHSQQIAVNTILGQLADDKGLLGVNGPPGTGKTTLLRDLIAAIVTRRADVLANLRRASDAFVADGREKANGGGKPQAVYRLNADLYGFEIVVASANNGAVENVTLELPQKDKIDESWLPDADYFGDLGELVSGKPAWALISAALGSKTRRNDFVKSYFYGEPSKRTKPPAEEATAVTEPEETDDNDVDLIEDSDEIDEIDEIEAVDVIAPTAVAEPRGFLRWLTKHADIERSTDQRLHIWEQAVAEYRATQRRVEQTAASATQIRGIVQPLGQSRQDASQQSATLEALRTKSEDVARRAAHLDAHDWKSAHAELQAVLQSLESHAARKPTFWSNLLSLGRHGRVWSAMHQTLTQRHALADAGFLHVNRQAKQLAAERKTLEQSTIEGTSILEQMQARVQQLIAQATEIATSSRATHLLTWLKTDDIGRGPAIELLEPWIIDPWRQARAGLFIQALKLHRTLFELEAKRFKSNLSFINSTLRVGRFQGVSRDAIRSAWASLFMVVPVLSSTFASFARSFGSLSAGEIGWLFVDEAGQATPQAAVGALWRSRRAVLVGDPLQLKPIVTVSDAVLEYMRTRYDVAPHWLPNCQSAQTLADQATTWGCLMGPADNKTWVGLPLVVHRRCDRPMYELANRIAYDGAMVYGTLAPSLDKETPASLATGWIHAAGSSTGNWVPAEGRALRQLVAQLQSDGVALNDISVITPFKAVRDQLKRLLPSGVVRGTIHTMQGKESAVVIIVLGGNTASPGARDWAVSEPNLINVAATRAKRRLYVVGDIDDWKCRRLFCDVMELLPLQALPVETSPMRLA